MLAMELLHTPPIAARIHLRRFHARPATPSHQTSSWNHARVHSLTIRVSLSPAQLPLTASVLVLDHHGALPCFLCLLLEFQLHLAGQLLVKGRDVGPQKLSTDTGNGTPTQCRMPSMAWDSDGHSSPSNLASKEGDYMFERPLSFTCLFFSR